MAINSVKLKSKLFNLLYLFSRTPLALLIPNYSKNKLIQLNKPVQLINYVFDQINTYLTKLIHKSAINNFFLVY